MATVVVGAGPVGLFSAMALARRGHDVTLVDRDSGPGAGGTWQRRGVMQFRHPHFFRPIVRNALLAELPDGWDAIVAAGGLPVRMEGAPEAMTGLQARRSTVETALWACAAREPRLTLRSGHVDRIESSGDRVTGVVVDSATIDADLVIIAGGRACTVADDLRDPAVGGPSGFSYVSRMYRGRTGDEVPTSPVPLGTLYDGYLTIVFPQDANTLSTLIVRDSEDDVLAQLRHQDVFDAIAPTIPSLAPWIDPDRFESITEVMAGAGLTNTYRPQTLSGRVPVAGVIFVGDAVSTTNPAAGRGVSLGLRQAQALLALLDADASDPRAVALQFDSWCEENIVPWFRDHVYWDATLRARWRGTDLDLDAKIPSDVVCAAAAVDPSIGAYAGQYLAMLALPSVLDPAQEQARAVLRTGWRPPWADGPTGDELTASITEMAVPA